MWLLDTIKGWFASGQLPPVPPARPPTRPQALPSFKTQTAVATAALQNRDRQLANTDITTYRAGANSKTVIRDFAASSPDLSSTVFSYLRVGIPDSYAVIARDFRGVVDRDSTELAQEILRKVTFLGDPTLGFNPVTDLQSLSESLGKEAVLYGGMAIELSLDKQRMPTSIMPVSVTKLKWYEDGLGVRPVQDVGGQEIDLDIATFFYVSIDQDLLTAYSSSMIEPAIQSVVADAQFLNDLRKSMQRVIQPRLIATLFEEKIRDTAPSEVLGNADLLREYLNKLIAEVQAGLEGLNPEDALVGFDSVEYKLLSSQTGSGNVADTLKTVQEILESKLAAGAKTMPAILGRDSQGTATTVNAMLFLKSADVVRRKLNVLYSRMLTQAVRLLGKDVFVEFTYADLDLRPQGELEAYKSMKQSRVLELLSLGLISDEEACIQLTGNLPREGHIPLAGTMFKSGSGIVANPNSQTSTMNQLQPDTPAQPKGNPNA